MRVELKSLQPNPMRDFTVDPIDDEVVGRLKESIKEDGFWGGVVCRRTKHNGSGVVQIAAGHHRIKAAISAGIREADIFVGDIDDAGLIRIYARENATQRGNAGTALAGSVAAAIRFLAKAVLTGSRAEKIFSPRSSFEQAADSITSDRGLGREIIVRFLDGIPGINEGTVQQQLANLKSSGDYARIVREIQEEIEKEHKEALKELARAEAEQKRLNAEREAAEARQREASERRKEAARAERAAKEEAEKRRAAQEAQRAELARQKAEAEAALAKKRQEEAAKELAKFDALRATRDTANKAADKAESREVTFDFEGVSKHLRNASHIDVFRQLVTGQGIKPYLAVNKQEALARKLIQLAGSGEMTARFIRENVNAMIMEVKGGERKLDAEEKADLLRKDWEAKARSYQNDFARQARGLLSAAIDLAEHQASRPRGLSFHVTHEFRSAVSNVERAVARIRKEGIV